MSNILVTGGAGYIGSHTVRLLASSGYRPVIVDNLSEGHREAVLHGDLVEGEVGDEAVLEQLFASRPIDAVMHFASRCYVGESVQNPRRYYEENVAGALTLFRVMLRHGTRRFILSSTCATYGNPIRVPIDEGHPQNPVNPYGETKYFLERMLGWYDRAYGLRFVALRYFNAAGAGLDARLGESHDPETHLIPRILRVAKGLEEKVRIFGTDYPTPDGTCIRDYIHVEDLASAHVAALEWLEGGSPSDRFNLGTGRGYSVREIVERAREVTSREIPVEYGPRREGDPPELVADFSRARSLLQWSPRHSDLTTILESAWRWEQNRRY